MARPARIHDPEKEYEMIHHHDEFHLPYYTYKPVESQIAGGFSLHTGYRYSGSYSHMKFDFAALPRDIPIKIENSKNQNPSPEHPEPNLISKTKKITNS